MCEASLYPAAPLKHWVIGVLWCSPAGTAVGPHVGRHCSPRPGDNEAVGWAEIDSGWGDRRRRIKKKLTEKDWDWQSEWLREEWKRWGEQIARERVWGKRQKDYFVSRRVRDKMLRWGVKGTGKIGMRDKNRRSVRRTAGKTQRLHEKVLIAVCTECLQLS